MSTKRVAANRANAKRSTGPRTAGGKSQSRQNALKHGLAIPISALPELTEDVLKIARALAADAPQDPRVLEAAMRVAEAAVDVLRVRRVRVELLSRPVPELDPIQQMRSGKWTKKRLRQWVFSASAAQQSEKSSNPRSRSSQSDQQIEREIAVFEAAASQPDKLERYERRSLSRRDRAVKALDEIQAALGKRL